MASNEEDLRYVEYKYYNDAKNQYDRGIHYVYGEDTLDNTLLRLRKLNHNLDKNDYIVKVFFKLLSNSHAFYDAMTPNYCKYINSWLNKEYNNNYQSKIPKFDVFKKFVYELNDERYGNQNNSCEKYINHLDPKIINYINFLHSLYDAYNEIKTTPIRNVTDTCSKIVSLSKSYRISIDDYYDDDKKLYEKLDTIKELILEKIGNLNSDCVNNIYFSTPKKVIKLQEEEEARKKAAEQERERQEAIRTQREQQLKANELSLRRSESGTVGNTPSEEGTSEHIGDQRGIRTQVISDLGQTTQLLNSLESLQTSGGVLLEKDHTREGHFTYANEDKGPQGEVVYDQNGPDRTRIGTLGGSTGFPGYITEVFRYVEPAPILGVSGGMGALFLLFKYTPVGSFFGGRRGRFRQIPRSFNGPFPGDFPNFNEYEGGYIGYGPMNINPLAE
ncbi:hypothetical protein, conserved [Plasmodium vivax]|nr:hypothetical protein, conserved [Plasmodium vivax]